MAVSTTADHRPGTRLPKYEGEQTKIVHEMQVTESIQRELSGDAKPRPSTASWSLDLNRFIDEHPRPPGLLPSLGCTVHKIAEPIHSREVLTREM
jgi:hypothetical protein